MRKQFPALAYFTECYLHQDFDLLFGGFPGVLAAYLDQETSEEQKQLIQDIEDILTSDMSEVELEHLFFEKFDCNYDYLQHFTDSRAWLSSILEQIKP
ncbi:contact-dependent growth inhibition system immunity protein [Zophobihabitans entericus]|uniref:CdiI immunity protein domain-containing protein n=1 Tax=Zophobihabitans entericus TaxID=1635327 RepID=A0A6G9I9I5_9GAMM|nr:contact-dependent growth inhibition system immunity protein [Zophobihabitans entericus]QIQ20881.1 hypothetical protein IPMB12_03805 [Zophobihabitans entericus]